VRAVGPGAAVWFLAIGQTLAYTGVYYSFPALLPALEEATGWSKGQLAAGPTLAFLVMAVLTPFTGRLVDRGWGGEMLVWLPIVAAAGVAALAFVTTPLQWLGVWFLIGITQAGMLYESCFAFLIRRLGDGARAAITRVTLVAGFAGTLTFPMGHVFGQAFGGQGAMLGFALVILLGAVPVNFLGVRALRRAERVGTVRPPPEPGALKVAMRRVEFWAIAGMFGLLSLNHGILLTYVLDLFQDRGASLAMATLAASCFGPAQVLGRVVLMVNEKRTSNIMATLVSVGMMVAAAAVLLMSGVTPELVFVVAVSQGAGVGLLSILRPVLVAEILGRRGFGTVSGAAAVAPILASAAAPSVGAVLLVWGGPGLVYDCILGMTLAAFAVGVWLALGRRRLEG
jgi:MFS family permease